MDINTANLHDPLETLNTTIGMQHSNDQGQPVNARFFEGLIDEIEIHDRALFPSEVLAILNAGSAGMGKFADPEEVALELGEVTIPGLDLWLFDGPNNNANAGRRGSLANRALNAADLIAVGDIAAAIDELEGLLGKIDGQSPPPDWMGDSPERTALAEQASQLIAQLTAE